MRSAVLPGFVKLTAECEGGAETNFLYCDVFGWVTTANGVLADPVSAALWMPWKRPDGSHATQAEIVAAWNKVKARQDLRHRGGMIYKSVSDLRLDSAGVEHVFSVTLGRMVKAMRSRFPRWDEWCSDAQMAALAICWAIGPGWPAKFPVCAAACDRHDWLAAASEAKISTASNPGIKPRNRALRILFQNASVVDGDHLDHERLWWPRDIWDHPLAPDVGPVDQDQIDTPVVGTPVVDFDVVTVLPDTNPRDDSEPPPDDAA